MPTASEFSSIIQSDGTESKSRKGYALTLAAELYAGKPMDDKYKGSVWMERGKEIEEEAVARYSFSAKEPVTKVGFITDDKETHGCSPDRLVGDLGLLETKCLKAERHIEAMIYYRKNGHCQPAYIQQTQGQMWITGRAWCDLIFYHPDLPLLVIRQTPIMSVIAGLSSGLATLIRERDEIVKMLRS